MFPVNRITLIILGLYWGEIASWQFLHYTDPSSAGSKHEILISLLPTHIAANWGIGFN